MIIGRAPEIPSHARAMILIAPLLFVIAAWWTYGIPYFKDSNETFHSFLHGWNIVFANPVECAFVTNHGLPGESCPYTHNPNLPRYAHALLFLLNAYDVKTHVLVISLACAFLATVFARKLFSDPCIVALVLLFSLLDWVGLQYFTNTYRAFSFPLFWGTLLAMRSKYWAAVAFFVVFQFEYAFAVFVGVTALCAHSGWKERFWAVGGAALSLLLFGIQVFSLLGPENMASEFLATAARRGFAPLQFPHFYSYIVLATCGIALVIALGKFRENYLYRLYASMFAGLLATTIAFSGYVSDAYLSHSLPFITFFVAVGFAVVGSVLSFGYLLLAVPLVINSHSHFLQYPPLSTDYIAAARKYDELIYTDGPIYGAGFAANSQARYRDDRYLYLCLRRPWLGLNCIPDRQQETVLAQGRDFYIAERIGIERPGLPWCLAPGASRPSPGSREFAPSLSSGTLTSASTLAFSTAP